MAVYAKSACVAIKGAGYVYKGQTVPSTADPADVKRLIEAGMLVEKAAPVIEPKPKAAPRSTAKK